jgi:hypothetical protein
MRLLTHRLARNRNVFLNRAVPNTPTIELTSVRWLQARSKLDQSQRSVSVGRDLNRLLLVRSEVMESRLTTGRTP